MLLLWWALVAWLSRGSVGFVCFSPGVKQKPNLFLFSAMAEKVPLQPEKIPEKVLEASPSRSLRLRDAIWARQAVDDLVAAEFALSLEGSERAGEAVDYERLREQLDAVVEGLESGAGATAQDDLEREAVKVRAKEGALGLERRAQEVRSRYAVVVEDLVDDMNERPWSLTNMARTFVLESKRRAEAVCDLATSAFRGSNENRSREVLYVRGDGTVDWEGALQGAKAATAFSRDLWLRINGVERHGSSHNSNDDDDDDEEEKSNNNDHHNHDAMMNSSSLRQQRVRTSRFQKSTAIRRAREVRMRLLASVEATREAAVAKRGIARALAPTCEKATPATTRAALRAADAKSRGAEARRYLADLDLGLERACGALEIEIESIANDAPDSSFGSVRRLVAEFALLDAQVVALCRDARYSAGPAILEPELAMLRREVAAFCSRVSGGRGDYFTSVVKDADDLEDFLRNQENDTHPGDRMRYAASTALAATRRDLEDADAEVFAAARKNSDDILALFKTTFPLVALSANDATSSDRASLFFPDDASSPGSRFANAFEKLVASARSGLAFYADGSKLLASDVAFCFSLVGRAFNGETLASRDVNILRRTLKDLGTTIPFIVILLIPLTPLGHVFVFGAIQR